MVPDLYVHGFTVAKMNSCEECGDPKHDHVLKQLFVQVERNEIDEWELAAYVQVEVVDIVDGVDHGQLEPCVEVYRMPFPPDFHVRVAMLREMKKNPKFFTT